MMAGAARLVCRREQFLLEQPFESATGTHVKREVLCLQLQCADGWSGLGEAAPLPGYSLDTLHECEQALHDLSPGALEALASLETTAQILECVAALLPESVPSARFALETALLDRLGRKLGQSLATLLGHLLGRRELAPVPLCALLPGDPSRATVTAGALRAAGVRSFKLKIGPARVTSAQHAISSSLRSAHGDAVTLRLDANQSLERASLLRELGACAQYHPEFVEEPSAAAAWEDFAGSPCTVAVDESLQHCDSVKLRALSAQSEIAVLVLKPTALGGFSRCLELARFARAVQREVVVSHTLEGPLGWAACAQLALAIGPSPFAAGLYPLPHQLRASSPLVNAGWLVPSSSSGLGVSE